MQHEYDYLVIGGGSAGCAVAGRLAQYSSARIALVEAGPTDQSAVVTTPLGVALTARKPGTYNYGFRTPEQSTLDGRQVRIPRGRGLGGSSSINAMVYIRGNAGDYDRWADLGCQGWSWAEVLPYFKRSECNERLAGGADDAWHGAHGPLSVVDHRSPGPFSRYFIEAGLSAGHVFNADFNGTAQDGVGYYQVTQRNGERWNAARAYLRQQGAPGEDRPWPNLDVLTGAQVERILFENGRATGVLVRRGETQEVLSARCEVILSAGAIGSPQLLMASGIGPSEHLRDVGVPLALDAPGVGQNLQEHPDVLLTQLGVGSTDLLGVSLRGGVRMLGELSRYRRHRTGMFASNVAEAGGFFRSRPGLADPDLQVHFINAAITAPMKPGHGYSAHVCLLRPHSRGALRLRSPNVGDAPDIDLNMLSDPRDMDTMVAGVRLLRRILDQPPLARFGGRSVDPWLRAEQVNGSDDEAIRALIRSRAETAFHPVGTCRMGSDDGAVVDPQLRVRGIEGLRVVDASVMPTLISGNTNAPSMMIGEKAADMILGRQPLAAAPH
ncbi:GMC family oxidoreductase [Cupriavidus numazuensis]|uniref:Alcohol dehydrogenase [acceptor] n=1 Tax=Cupriavidus numazuensis TaxID=221992 RepID=A0ABM8TV75_9BURK|nr:GMC family oxidoreductase N-terminal domain-containing protein [Cupriavidus numazuensis]CAG2160552.1 Alcohol dehydrogenase [acceptor] [Cupriavidus numazuensis]